jgi:D-3-phosphoglycerate dehydrogenase
MEKTVLVTTSTFSHEDAAPREELSRAGLAVQENPYRRRLTEAEVLELLEKTRALGMIAGLEPLTARVLERCAPHLKVISRCGTGLDNVDLAAAERLGIRVFNTPGAPTLAVAELTIGLILAVLRRIAECDRDIREGRWERPMGRLLEGKTVGIVGCGRIGSRVARLAAAFGCRVIGYDPGGHETPGIERVPFEELLRTSHVVTLHANMNEQARGLINAERLALMRHDPILINASRGGLVDEEALLAALKEKRLAGAAVDTFEQEPYTGPLRELRNVVLTGHIGSAAQECRVRMELEAAANLVEGLRAAGAA